jgi:hypothetical protein
MLSTINFAVRCVVAYVIIRAGVDAVDAYIFKDTKKEKK